MPKYNPDDYRADIASLKLSEEQENLLLHTLWEMMRMFVEMGHGVNNINSIFPPILDQADHDSGNMLKEYNQAANIVKNEE